MGHSKVKHLPKVDHTPAELDEPRKILLRAAALIEDRGLAKWTLLECPGGALCARGAIILAGGGDESRGHTHLGCTGWLKPFVAEADDLLRSALGGESVPYWNNEPERTKAEVVAKLRAVALGLS